MVGGARFSAMLIRLIRNVILVLFSSFLLMELYYQVSLRASNALPSFMRIYDYRFFDSDGTPRFIPNTDAWHRTTEQKPDLQIHINSEAFRGNEPLSSPSVRIAMVGDSTLMNGGVELEETFPFILETGLRATFHDPNIEILNFGVGETNARQYYLKIKHHVLKFHPDLIVVFLYLNDGIESMNTGWDSVDQSAESIWYRSLAFERISKFFKYYYLLFDAKSSGRFDWVGEFQAKNYLKDDSVWREMRNAARQDWGAAWSKESWKTIEHYLSAIRDLGKAESTEIWFAILPVGPQVELSPSADSLFYPQELARQMSVKLNIGLLDPLTFFRAQESASDIYYDQCHFSPRGNKVMSEFLFPKLEEWIKKRH